MIDYSLKLKSGDTPILQARGIEQFGLAQEILKYCNMKAVKVISEFLTLEQFNEFWINITPRQLDEIIQAVCFKNLSNFDNLKIV